MQVPAGEGGIRPFFGVDRPYTEARVQQRAGKLSGGRSRDDWAGGVHGSVQGLRVWGLGFVSKFRV